MSRLGRFGIIARDSLKQNDPATYNKLLQSGKLDSFLKSKEKTYEEGFLNYQDQLMAKGHQPSVAHQIAEETFMPRLLTQGPD